MIIIKEKVVKLFPLFGLLFFGLFLLSVSRLLLYFFNKQFFELTVYQVFKFYISGLRFDFSAFSYVNLLFVFLFLLPFSLENKFYRFFIGLSFLIPNALAIAINILDSVYFRFTFSRSNSEIFSFASSIKQDFKSLGVQFFKDFWFAFLLFFLFVFILVFLWRKIFIERICVFSSSKKCIYVYLFSILILPSILVFGARGGFQIKPISILTAGIYAESKNTPLVLNSAFTVIRTFGNSRLETYEFFENEDEMFMFFKAEKKYFQPELEFRDKNIVLIILEGFSNEHLNSINQNHISEDNFAPFLDSLIHEGIFFNNTFANGKRSVEGIPSIISSTPSLMNTPFILSQYSNVEVHSFANLLKRLNYHTAFFHGGKNGTMNLDYYSAAVGFEEYFGKNEYNNNKHFDNAWGIWDEYFLQFAANKITGFNDRFFACIFTLSSHHPYNVPQDLKKNFPEGSLPIHKSIAYADYSLKRFFETAEKSDWYSNTIFVITSDHSSEPYSDYYKSTTGRFSIPFLIFEPALKNKYFISKTTQQTDILPTVLDYINFPFSFSAFGNSAFNINEFGFSLSFANGQFQIIKNNLTASIHNNKIVSLYDNQIDFFQNNNLIENQDFHDEILLMLNIYKSLIQQYSFYLNNNSLSKHAKSN